jgi:hypothetical protein
VSAWGEFTAGRAVSHGGCWGAAGEEKGFGTAIKCLRFLITFANRLIPG